MQYRRDKYGNELSILGYGCMRFTKKGNKTDIDKAEREILAAYAAGVNYYDTAYIYGDSEAVIGEIFERNHMREKIHIATKLPQYMIRSREGLDKYFDEELARLRTNYVDYYLMHHLTDVAMWEKLKEIGILDWISAKKASGAIANIGFSYHGNTENFLKILDDYDWDFCQIQYNYLDEVAQAGVTGLKAAAEKGIPVMIMEPLRGGKLVNMLPAGALEAMKKSGRNWTPAEWGLRWLYDQKEVTVVLSGMNSVEMKGVDIPGIFRCYNTMYTESKTEGRFQFAQTVGLAKEPPFATQCIQCGKCEQHCPQNIPIREKLKEADKALRPLPYKIGIAVARKFMFRK